MNRRFPQILVRIALSAVGLLVFQVAPTFAESDSARVSRLYQWASDGSVRYRDRVDPAVDSLGQMGETAARYMVQYIDRRDARERLYLSLIFGKIGKEGTQYLTPFLVSDDWYTAHNAARCLGEIADSQSVGPLVEALDHPVYLARSRIAETLGRIGDARATPALINQLLGDSIEEVRKSCVYALGRCGDPAAADPLIDALGDVHYGPRQAAVTALGEIGPAATSAILGRIQSMSDIARYGAIVALGQGDCFDKSARNYLRSLLDTDDPLTRGFAIEALGTAKDGTSEKRIRKLSGTETDPFVRDRVERYFRMIAE